MSQRETFPGTIERDIIREFMMGRIMRATLDHVRLDVNVWESEAQLVLLPHSIAIARIKEGALHAAPLTGELSSFEPYQTKTLVFIFEELGDQRAYQPRHTWFSKAGARVMCGPMTLCAYRASQREKATNEPA